MFLVVVLLVFFIAYCLSLVITEIPLFRSGSEEGLFLYHTSFLPLLGAPLRGRVGSVFRGERLLRVHVPRVLPLAKASGVVGFRTRSYGL